MILVGALVLRVGVGEVDDHRDVPVSLSMMNDDDIVNAEVFEFHSSTVHIDESDQQKFPVATQPDASIPIT